MFGYLFYSKMCPDCGTFFKIIKMEGIANGFNMVSVDDIPATQISKLNLTVVPAVMVRDNSGNSNLYEGPKALEWLRNLVQFRHQNMAKMAEMQRRKILISNASAGVGNVGLGHAPMETTGISDDFSYLITDHALPKSFMPYGHDDLYKISTPINTAERKMSEGEQKSHLSMYDKSRSMQNASIEQYIENQLRETLCNNLTQSSGSPS
jgi:hypothetical protein